MLIILFFALLFSFDTGKLNSFAARINNSVQEKISEISSPSSEPAKFSTAKPSHSSFGETSNTLNELNQTYKETKQQVKETKQSISEGVKDVKRAAGDMARKIPRTEKQANQIFLAFAEKYFGGWGDTFRSFGERFRQSSQGISKASASKASKINPSRQR